MHTLLNFAAETDTILIESTLERALTGLSAVSEVAGISERAFVDTVLASKSSLTPHCLTAVINKLVEVHSRSDNDLPHRQGRNGPRSRCST